MVESKSKLDLAGMVAHPHKTRINELYKSKGRPSDYSDIIFNCICDKLADGKSLKSVCEASDMPSKATFYNWINNSADLLDKYARAKEDSSDALAEDIQDIADKVLTGGYEANNARVAIDAKKWVASKLKPKKYGDKLDMTTNGKELPTPLLFAIRGSKDEVSDNDSDPEVI